MINKSTLWNSKESPWLKQLLYPIRQAIIGFIEDDCSSKASALTFYSLLSVVPILAVLFGIAKGFGFEQALENELNNRFIEQPELMHKLIDFAHSWLQSVQGGVIAGIGTLALLWSVLGLLNNIEKTLNVIWKVPYSRSISRRISDYLAMIMICPIFLVTSASVTLFLNTQITQTAQNNSVVAVLSPFFLSLLRLFPFFLSSVLFSFIYLLIPNTKVSLRSALWAGGICGTFFQLWQWMYIKFQIGVASYGAIYGSFAALPFFLIWLQISWLILLAGAEIAYAIQCSFFSPKKDSVMLSNKALALLIVYRCAEAFARNNNPPTDTELTTEFGITLKRFTAICESLEKGRILSAITFNGKVQGYQPARALSGITYKLIYETMENQEAEPCFINISSLPLIDKYLKFENHLLENEYSKQPVYCDTEKM